MSEWASGRKFIYAHSERSNFDEVKDERSSVTYNAQPVYATSDFKSEVTVFYFSFHHSRRKDSPTLSHNAGQEMIFLGKDMARGQGQGTIKIRSLSR